MKICKVIATNSQGEKQVFTFGTATPENNIITTKGSRLNVYLEYCFREDGENSKDVEVIFLINEDEYSLSKLHNDDGSTRTVLKKKVEDRWQVVSRTKSIAYLEQELNAKLTDVLKFDYVNDKTVNDFHGNLYMFDQIRMLTDLQESVTHTASEAKVAQEKALQKVIAYNSQPQANLTTEQIDQLNVEIVKVSQQLALATAELADLQAKQVMGGVSRDIAQDLKNAQIKYNQLLSRQQEIEQMRQSLALRDQAMIYMPRIRALNAIAEQRTESENKRYAITTDIENTEAELANINKQLEEKQAEYALIQDRKGRISSINKELNYIAGLYEKNKELNEQLITLTEKQQQLTGEKTLCLNKLQSIETTITEIKSSLDSFDVPAKSVGELLETVRVDVRIDEVQAQIDKLQGEIAVKESQIAEREAALVALIKRFRSVAEIDVAVTPIKAKDTICQVLDAKCGKLEAINQSLQEKLKNLERASEDFKFRIIQLEQAKSRLEAERERTLLRKQEEFKREVYLNSQKVYNDDVSSVFATSVSFHDAEVDQLDQEISSMAMDRDLLYEQAYKLEGAIAEIKRHIDINNAEIATLQKEKTNIVNRYNEIVTQNSSEVVFNYIKALNANNGTKYLLDIQQEAVRAETELTELKRQTELLRGKVANLKSRLAYLQESHTKLDVNATNVDTLVTTNDKIKEELTDIGQRLSASYEQYKSVTRQLESIESRLNDVIADIAEITRTIKVNETQIAEAEARAKRLAGDDDIEKAMSNFKYELSDVESERQMLIDAKKTLEQDLFNKRLELEKVQWIYESKNNEYAELYQELQLELNIKGLSMEAIVAIQDDQVYQAYRRVIAEYDTTRATLAEKVESLYKVLTSSPIQMVSNQQIEQKRQQIIDLQRQQQQLQAQRDEQMGLYVAASSARTKATVAAAEVRTLSNMRSSLDQGSIVGLLIRDKINATITLATTYLQTFTGKKYVVTQKEGVVYVTVDDQKVSYDDLPMDIKTATYVSVVLSVPTIKESDGKWLIFDERVNLSKEQLDIVGLTVDKVDFVVDYQFVEAQ